jgi:hypothetical protein
MACTRGQLEYGPPLDFSFKDLHSIEGTGVRLVVATGHCSTIAFRLPELLRHLVTLTRHRDAAIHNLRLFCGSDA